MTAIAHGLLLTGPSDMLVWAALIVLIVVAVLVLVWIGAEIIVRALGDFFS